MSTREEVAAALFTQLQTAGAAFKTYSQRVRLWSDVPNQEKPFLCLMEIDESDRGESVNMPTVRRQNFKVLIYTDAHDLASSVYPRTLINDAITAVEIALTPSPVTNTQTLGGRVINARIEGEVFKDPGDLDGDGVAIIPVTVLVPG